MAEKWSSVTVECWNYRYHSVGRTRTVEIGQNRYCESDCDATTCPLNKPKKASNRVRELIEKGKQKQSLDNSSIKEA